MNDQTSPLPEPMVPRHVDLRTFEYMPLHVLRLRDSDFGAIASGDEFKAAVLLWCAAWHQLPAGSLPDIDRAMAKLIGYGLSEWNQVKDVATRGFVKCSDGRLYHAVLSDIVKKSWEAKRKQKDRTKNATQAKKRMSEQEILDDERRYDERDEVRNDSRHDGRNVKRDDNRNVDRNVERHDDNGLVQRNVHQLEVKDKEKLLPLSPDFDSSSSGDRGGAGGDSLAAPIQRRRPPAPVQATLIPPAAPAEPKRKKAETSIPPDFRISDRVRAWASEKGHDRLEQRFEHFVGWAVAKGARYASWEQTFMNAIRDDWAQIDGRGYTNRANGGPVADGMQWPK